MSLFQIQRVCMFIELRGGRVTYDSGGVVHPILISFSIPKFRDTTSLISFENKFLNDTSDDVAKANL